MPKGLAPILLLALVLAHPSPGSPASPVSVWWLDSLAGKLSLVSQPLGFPTNRPTLPATQEDALDVLCRLDSGLPLYADATVLDLARWYAGPGWESWLQLRRAARPAMEEATRELEKRQLPQMLSLLPLALGGHPLAGTPFAQAGPWRLDLASALHHGLCVDAQRDDRRSVEKSTRAALDRLQELQLAWDGDWNSTLVAFLCGSANLSRAQAHCGADADLEVLAQAVATPERHILPLFMAFVLLEASCPEARHWPALALAVEKPASLSGESTAPAASLSTPRIEGLPEGPAPARQRVVVKSGDTLEGLARRHGISIRHLKQWNGLRHDLIRPGQRLFLSSGKTTESARAASPERDSQAEAGEGRLNDRKGKATFRWYTVRPGDTLYDIAAAHPGVRVKDIMALNKISATIQPGQRIRIPLP